MPDSRLSHDGNLDGTPGAALTFPHVFTAGTRGSLRLSSSAVPSPPAENWTDALYRDINCNGQIDVDTDTLIPSEQVFDLDAGQNLCLVHKQFIPANAATGHRNVVTLRAELTYANAAPALSAVYTREDRTTVAQSGALELVKEVRHTGPNCAPLPSPQGDWASNNQARPGDWLQYRITYRNKNIDPLRNLVITDATPAFTRYVNATCGTSTPDGSPARRPAPAAIPIRAQGGRRRHPAVGVPGQARRDGRLAERRSRQRGFLHPAGTLRGGAVTRMAARCAMPAMPPLSSDPQQKRHPVSRMAFIARKAADEGRRTSTLVRILAACFLPGFPQLPTHQRARRDLQQAKALASTHEHGGQRRADQWITARQADGLQGPA